MQQVLVLNEQIISFGGNIEFGLFENDRYKWCVMRDGITYEYVIDPNTEAFTVEECTLRVYTVASLPEDYAAGKYFFVDGKFVLNESYSEPQILLSNEELSRMVTDMKATIAAQKEEIALLNETLLEVLMV